MPILKITVSPLPLMLDPEARAIQGALVQQGYDGVLRVTCHRMFEVEVEQVLSNKEVERMCQGLLINPAVERYTYEWESVG